MTERLSKEERERLRALLAQNDGADAMQVLIDNMAKKNMQGLPGSWKRPTDDKKEDE